MCEGDLPDGFWTRGTLERFIARKVELGRMDVASATTIRDRINGAFERKNTIGDAAAMETFKGYDGFWNELQESVGDYITETDWALLATAGKGGQT